MSKYWLKLYHETLHDPKVQRLSDRHFRRMIEIFLFAGEHDQGGLLPSIDDMAWTLRTTAEELEADLDELAKIEIVSECEDGWCVTNFERRQAAMSSQERVKRHREGKRKKEYYSKPDGNGDVTNRYTDIDIDSDEDIDVEEELFGRVIQTWEKANGPITPILAESLGDLVDEVNKHLLNLQPQMAGADLAAAEWVIEGIKTAAGATAGRFSIRYLEAIVDRWMREGYQSQLKPKEPDDPQRDQYEPDAMEKTKREIEELKGKE